MHHRNFRSGGLKISQELCRHGDKLQSELQATAWFRKKGIPKAALIQLKQDALGLYTSRHL